MSSSAVGVTVNAVDRQAVCTAVRQVLSKLTANGISKEDAGRLVSELAIDQTSARPQSDECPAQQSSSQSVASFDRTTFMASADVYIFEE